VILAARCGAAARSGTNEDNCLIISSVGNPKNSNNHFGDGEYLSEAVSLGKNGCLLVVADGMGGMNAGEVASAIAIDTIAKIFLDEGISRMDLTDNNVRKLLRKAVTTADNAIKKAAAKDKEKEGMGTTVAMLWLLQGKAYYAWCGDSRIYRYNDSVLDQLSNDHSYVCEVLHLSEEEAFTHPNNNIITRCLGNPSEQAVPETPQPETLAQGDLFLLCSDGLCGVLRNSDIVDLLRCAAESPGLKDGTELLWKAAEEHHWHDNVTTLLCYVKSGPAPRPKPEKPAVASQTIDPEKDLDKVAGKKKGKGRAALWALLAILVVSAAAALYFHLRPKPLAEPEAPVPIPADSAMMEGTFHDSVSTNPDNTFRPIIGTEERPAGDTSTANGKATDLPRPQEGTDSLRKNTSPDTPQNK
jgi:protein phosphatase